MIKEKIDQGVLFPEAIKYVYGAKIFIGIISKTA
jgi:hypothetical protein